MELIQFKCPVCKEIILADENQVGHKARCPFCENVITVSIHNNRIQRKKSSIIEQKKDATPSCLRRLPRYMWVVITAVFIPVAIWIYGFLVAFADVQNGQNLFGAAIRIYNMNLISACGYRFYLNVFTDMNTKREEIQKSLQELQRSLRELQPPMY